MEGLDGTWDVRRVSGVLPPLLGMRKRISGTWGETVLGPARAHFDVVGNELRYRAPLTGFVDVLERDGDGFAGRALLRGLRYGRFRLDPVAEPATTPLDEVLVRHLDEAVAMEEGVIRMLGATIGTTDDAGLVELLERHRSDSEAHAERLRARLEERGGTPSSWREAAAVLGVLAKAPLDAVRGAGIARSARDAYATEHLEIAAYRLLEEVAERAGDLETAEVARRNRAEEEAMARALDERWPRIADLALRAEGVETPESGARA